MKRNAKLAAERLKKVILTDKVAHPEQLNDLVLSDITELLQNYFELLPESVVVRLVNCEYGLDIMIDARAARVKPYGSFR